MDRDVRAAAAGFSVCGDEPPDARIARVRHSMVREGFDGDGRRISSNDVLNGCREDPAAAEGDQAS